jgi:hypothetical protein
MIPVHSQYTIDVGLLEQNGGWVMIAVEHNKGFYGKKLFSGKRRTLEDAMSLAKQLAPTDSALVYSRLDNVINDWK